MMVLMLIDRWRRHLSADIVAERLLERVVRAQLDCLLSSDLVGRGMKAMLVGLAMLGQVRS